MELAHLVHTLKPTIHFFVIGAILLAVKIGFSSFQKPEPTDLVVTVPDGASQRAIEEETNQAILVEEGLRLGWVDSDHAIRRHLVRNMRFIEGSEGGDHELYQRAIELGMHRRDPVVRKRLVMRAHRLIDERNRRIPPSDRELREFMDADLIRYSHPEQVRFTHVFLSAQGRSDDVALNRDVESLGRRLANEKIPPEQAFRLGDPFLHAQFDGLVSIVALDRRFGQNFGQNISKAPVGQWHGPVRSSYGLHYVYIDERIVGARRSLSDVRRQVTEDFFHRRRLEIRSEALKKLRSYYRIRIQYQEQ